MAPAKLRGTLNVLFQLFITIGEATSSFHRLHRSAYHSYRSWQPKGICIHLKPEQLYDNVDASAGILVAGCINLGAKDISPWGWRLPLAIAGMICQLVHCACFPS